MTREAPQSVLVVGGGVFGTVGALTLARRGFRATLVDPGPLPHELAASTDISKVIRMDYGTDPFYMELMEIALDGWRAWNAEMPRPLFHETGFLLLSRQDLRPGGYEFESLRLLETRGHHPVRLTGDQLKTRFPAWSEGGYVDGYFNPEGGWAESGEVVRWLVDSCQRHGVTVQSGRRAASLIMDTGRVTGVNTSDGERLSADWVVVAAGAWTPKLVPSLSDRMRPIGQPVFHFQVKDPAAYQPPAFVPWAADISSTGWYGFCALEGGLFKLANHGPGVPIDPDAPREIQSGAEARFRRFLMDSLPDLTEAPVAGSRLCLYCDTWDGDFYIDRDPEHEGLVVATGGSGHGFKFAPVLGGLIADAVQGVPNPSRDRFAWRPRGGTAHEQARFSVPSSEA